MRITSSGQVTIPADVRQLLGLAAGDEVDFVLDGQSAYIIRAQDQPFVGHRQAAWLRGKGSSGMSTAEIMELMRGD